MAESDSDWERDPDAAEASERRLAPIPAGEAARLADLYETGILDTPAEESFDSLARTAAYVAGVPIALVSMIDENRQWFKAQHGLSAGETSRQDAFCAHAILDPTQPLIVEDAAQDPRFRDNPFVLDDPSIRFYCGVPVVSEEGRALGTLCVIDSEPHTLGVEQVEALKGLANQVSALLQARARVRAAERRASDDDDAHLRLLRLVATVSASTTGLEDMLQRTLEALVSELDLSAGGLWWRSGDLLVTQALWVDPRGELEGLRHAREGLAYPPEVILHLQETATRHGAGVLPTVVTAALHAHGISGVYAAPIVVDGETLGAFELVPRTGRELSGRQMLAATQAGAEVGRWLERDQAARWVREASTHDALTGLLNRRSVPTLVEHALVGGVGGAGGVGLINIGLNRFVEITASLSDEQLDALVLQAVALVQAVLPEGTRLARQSESSLLAIVDGVADTDAVGAIAARIHAAFKEPIVLDWDAVPVGVSIGIAHMPYGGDHRALLASVDQALIDARSAGAGRTNAAVVRPEEARRRLAIKARIAQALADDALRVVYQPLVHLASNRPVAAEALVRWTDPAFGEIQPHEFIPVAEESRAIGAIGSFVRTRALRDLPYLRGAGAAADGFSVWVNASAREIEPGFAQTVLGELALAGVAAPQLTIEVTERLVLGDGAPARELVALAEAGVHIAVDDFGTGFTSLTQLRHLPLSRIKIDRSFTRDLVGDDRARVRPIVAGIIQLGHALGLEIVTEGIETQGQLDAVRELGADLAQGYFLGHPEPIKGD